MLHTSDQSPAPLQPVTLAYEADLLGNIQQALAGLQGFGIMALELIQNADDAGASSLLFDVTNAEAFIGRPIDVELEHRQGANDSGFKLLLRMDDQLRSVPDTVSESQRFFIDIALRMAILEYMASGPATLFIDTPVRQFLVDEQCDPERIERIMADEPKL
jgi:hypothetical protein